MNNTYRKNRATSTVGDYVSIPGHAVGVTISDLSPFGESVQVSWLEPTWKNNKGIINKLRVNSYRTRYTDTSDVEIPYCAIAHTVWEPPDSDESVIYWLS
jgi:hypothetical protein